jgi:hypothetical protein
MMEELGALCDDRIVNCSGVTALKNFKRGDLKTELEEAYEQQLKIV